MADSLQRFIEPFESWRNEVFREIERMPLDEVERLYNAAMAYVPRENFAADPAAFAVDVVKVAAGNWLLIKGRLAMDASEGEG